MNWISQNKFLAGFFGVMIVGAGVLGFLLYQAMSNYTDVHTTYTASFQKLQNLQNLKPFPNEPNLENYEQKSALADVITGLEQKLVQIQFPLDASATPPKFQAKLQAIVSEEIGKAKTGNIVIPDKFALGFDKYLSSPPVQTAAAPLDRELNAVKFIFDELLDGSGVESISAVSRIPLPEEGGAKPSTGLVVKSPLEITFTSDWEKFRKVMNDLVETNKQFYIVRLVQITNKEGKPISKVEAMRTRTQKDGNLRFVLGDEKLEVTLSLEVVNFNPPPK